jgi:AcrR family transcriptional regulator
MQKLKPEIREKILSASEQMFFALGYEAATTRQIAAGVGISVSNLYKYFADKQAIFNELIGGYAASYKRFFSEYISHGGEEKFGKEGVENLSRALFESIRADRVKFVILMSKSEGTGYSEFKKAMVSALEKHIREGLKNETADAYILKILVDNFINGIIEIASKYRDDKWAFDNIKLLAEYHLAGMEAIYK